jgi:hypothetical protein
MESQAFLQQLSDSLLHQCAWLRAFGIEQYERIPVTECKLLKLCFAGDLGRHCMERSAGS